MKKEEAIKYLQQLYPYGGHCWLDEQRIEAIGMAVKALQEEPVSKELDEEIEKYRNAYYRGIHSFPFSKIARHFANWQMEQDQSIIELAEDHAMLAGMEKMREQMMKDAVEQDVDSIWANPINTLERLGLQNFNGKVKLIIIKEE